VKKILQNLFIASFVLISFASIGQSKKLNLQGTWRFAIDSLDKGVQEKWFSQKLKDKVKLPGSMLENGKGNAVTLQTQWTGSIYDSSWYFNPRMAKYRQGPRPKFPFWLTPKKHYVGGAWYQRDIVVPADWKNQRIWLNLERPHYETRVWIDNQEIGLQNSLCVAHVYDLTGKLSTGKHTLTVRVDNKTKEINVGKDSHSITDHTQGNWNGIVGKMELSTEGQVWFSDVQVYPNVKEKLAKVVIQLENNLTTTVAGKISLSAKSFNSSKQHSVAPLVVDFKADKGSNTLTYTLPMGDNFLTWDEYTPALYKLNVQVSTSEGVQSVRDVQFGMRDFAIDGTRFEINGRPIFLRGTVENCQFPLTGYAPMDVASWEKVFKKAKSYGLNHFRFHSYCPPEAAFIAADLVGIYLQPEGPSWANHGSSLGDGHPIDQYIMDETNRMAKVYGNYASFCMLAYGNEPRGGKQVDYLTKFIKYWQAKDPRRKYTGASVAMSWPLVPANEYMIKSGPRGLPWDKLPSSSADFGDKVKNFTVPYVTHELGQWCVFPNFDEIKKYKGLYEARNYELFQEDLKDRGMADRGKDFFMASGKLQAISYKHEMEMAFRTPLSAGFQMLGLNDYSGQGTALVGLLDSFWEEKGYIDAKEFRQFCDSTVVLTRFPKFIFQQNESIEIPVELFHFGQKALSKAVIAWQIVNSEGKTVQAGEFQPSDYAIGNNLSVGKITVNPQQINQAQKLLLKASINGSEIQNQWAFWIYPTTLPAVKSEEVYSCNSLDERALQILEKGGKVFLQAAGKIERGKEVVNYLQPVFWNTSWFKMRPPHTLGFVCDPKHPAFQSFPTEFHANVQWWELVNKTQVMLLDEFPKGFKPVVQPIDTWFLNRPLGLIVEAKVGRGKLLICSADISSNLETRPVARQLAYSLQQYMVSSAFNPQTSVDLQVVKNLFDKSYNPNFNTYTKDAPDELKVKKNGMNP